MAPPKIIKALNESEVICTYDEASNPIVPKKTFKSIGKDVLDVFLPAGYPHTVTPDYTPYQIYVRFLASRLRNSYVSSLACLYIY